MKHLEKLTDKQLSAKAKEIAAEEKRRANLKAAASAILTILKKHRLSAHDLTELNLGQKPTALQKSCRQKKASAATKRRLSKIR